MKKNNGVRLFLAFVLSTFLIAGVLRLVTGHLFQKNVSLAGAFQKLSPEKEEAVITLTGRFSPASYGFSEKKLLESFANRLNLKMDSEPHKLYLSGREELIFEKNGEEAHSVLRVVILTETEEVYLCGDFTLYNISPEGAAVFREELCKKAKRFGLSEISSTIELCGLYRGEIPLGKKDELVDRLLRELYAEPVYENRENDNYTVYAYTGSEKELVVVGHRKINVQAAIYYDENTDISKVILASPLSLR